MRSLGNDRKREDALNAVDDLLSLDASELAANDWRPIEWALRARADAAESAGEFVLAARAWGLLAIRSNQDDPDSDDRREALRRREAALARAAASESSPER